MFGSYEQSLFLSHLQLQKHAILIGCIDLSCNNHRADFPKKVVDSR